MDPLGQRIESDTRTIADKLARADEMEAEARKLRQEAREIGRLMELARWGKPT